MKKKQIFFLIDRNSDSCALVFFPFYSLFHVLLRFFSQPSLYFFVWFSYSNFCFVLCFPVICSPLMTKLTLDCAFYILVVADRRRLLKILLLNAEFAKSSEIVCMCVSNLTPKQHKKCSWTLNVEKSWKARDRESETIWMNMKKMQ